MNAAEKARMAREAQRKENRKNRAKRKVLILGLIFIALSVAALVVTVIVYINEFKSLNTLTNEGLKSVKSLFWTSIAILAVGVIFTVLGFVSSHLINKDYNKGNSFYDYYIDEKSYMYSIPAYANIVTAVANLVLVVIVLFSGKLGVKNYFVVEDDGLIYAQTSKGFDLEGRIEGKNDIVIRGEVNGYFFGEVEKSTFKNDLELHSVEFADGDMKINKKAFAGCSNLEVVTFGDYSYEIEAKAFHDSFKLKEFNVGSAEITIPKEFDYSSAPYYDSVLGGISNACVTISGGKIHYMSDSVAMYKIGNNSEVIIKSDPESESNGNNSGYIINKVAVFEDDFTFEGSKFINAMNTKLFSEDLIYYPFAYTVYIPKSVTSIPDYFFGDEMYKNSEVKLYYAGSETEWANVTVSSTGNSNYSNGSVKITYNTPYSE